MKKNLLIWVLLCGATLPAARAQFSDHFVGHFGLMWESFNMVYADPTRQLGDDFAFNYTTIGVGGYYSLAHAKDVVSVGIDGSAQVGIRFATNFGNPIYVKVPVYAAFRLGALATPYNQQAIGISAGIGGSFNHLDNFRILSEVRRSTFFNPGVMLQGTLITRGSPITGRIHFSLSQPESILKYTGDNPGGNNGLNVDFPYRYQGILGFGLLYGF
ncbi:MAG: hypothetical protein OHK0039_31950 [Bacteroidia bacterium]